MPKEVFDQAQPHNSKARLFAEAFRGCDEWTVPPHHPRRSDRDDRPDRSPRRFQRDIFDFDMREAA